MHKELSVITTAARRRLSRIGFAFFVFFATALLLQFFLVSAVSVLRPEWIEAPIFIWLQSIAPMYCVAFPLFYLILRPLPCGEADGRPMRLSDLTVLFFIAFSVMYITNLIGTAINFLTDAIFGTSSSAGATELITASPLYLTVIFAVFIGPIVEEAIFRGILLRRLLPFGDGFAILVSALLFGLFHGNFAQFFYAFAIGLIFGLIACRTGRLRYTVILHTALNFVGSIPSTILLRRTEELGIGSMDEAALLENPEARLVLILTAVYSLLLLAAVAVGLYLLARYLKKMKPRPAAYPIPKGEGRYLVLSVGGTLYLVTLLFLFALSYL